MTGSGVSEHSIACRQGRARDRRQPRHGAGDGCCLRAGRRAGRRDNGVRRCRRDARWDRREDCARAVAETEAAFGHLDVVVNNAGKSQRYHGERGAPFWETEAEGFRLVIETNVVGPYLMARAAVPAMIERGWGRVINITKSFDSMHEAHTGAYGPSKAALEAASLSWAEVRTRPDQRPRPAACSGRALRGLVGAAGRRRSQRLPVQRQQVGRRPAARRSGGGVPRSGAVPAA